MRSRSQPVTDWKGPGKTAGTARHLSGLLSSHALRARRLLALPRHYWRSRPGLRAFRKRRPRAGVERGAPAFERSIKGLAGIAQKRGTAARSWSKLETL